MAYNGTRVIDGDGHVVEPGNLWEQYLEPPYKDRAPRLVRDNRGLVRLMIEGRLFPKPEGKNTGISIRGINRNARIEFSKGTGEANGDRVKAMDVDGIDVALLFPTLGLLAPEAEDPDLAAALARAYNDWLADYYRPYPERLLGAALVCLNDIQAACAEAVRAVSTLKMKAIFIRPNPCLGRTADDRAYDPFYRTLEELGVPLMFHEGTGFTTSAGTDRYDNFFFTHTISHPFTPMLASLSIIGGGVLERFPELQAVFLESGAGWMPYWLWRMDEHYEKLPHLAPWLKMKPSEYFQRQAWISCDPDEATVPMAVELLGEDKVLFASDYPHWDRVFPRTVKERSDNPKLSPSAKRKVLGENAARLLGI